MQIDSNPVVLGVSVEEHAELKQRVRAVFDARDHASRRERGLFDVTVEIFGVFVQRELAKPLQLF